MENVHKYQWVSKMDKWEEYKQGKLEATRMSRRDIPRFELKWQW